MTNEGGTVRYHRADYRPGTDEPWLVWFTKDQADPYWFTAEQGEAMGLTPQEPAPLVVTCNGHNIELRDDEAEGYIELNRACMSIGTVSGRLAGLLRDARQDPQPASEPEPPTPCDECETTGRNCIAHRSQPEQDDTAGIDFDALPIGTVAEVTLLDGDRLLALKTDDEPGRNWFIGDCSDVDITKLRDVRIVYQPAPLSRGECLRGLLAGRDDADHLIQYAARAFTAEGGLLGAIGDAAREVHG